MTLFAKTENKSCFIACEQLKIDSGLCDCINRMPQQGKALPLDSVSGCSCMKYRWEVRECGNRFCTNCGENKTNNR